MLTYSCLFFQRIHHRVAVAAHLLSTSIPTALWSKSLSYSWTSQTHCSDRNAYVQLSVLPAHPPSSRCCGAPLEYFYTDSALEQKFKLLLDKPDALFFVLKDDQSGAIVGLIAGYLGRAGTAWNENIKDKLTLQNGDHPLGAFGDQRVVYIDEIGILRTYRCGRVPFLRLFSSLTKAANDAGGAMNILFWTRIDSRSEEH